MNLRQYVVIFALGTLITFIAWVVTLTQIDPVDSGTVGLVLFYITFGAWVMGALSAAGTGFRAIRHSSDDEHPIRRSLRQAFLITALILTTMLLLSHGYLRGWMLILLVLLVGAIEFFILSLQQNR